MACTLRRDSEPPPLPRVICPRSALHLELRGPRCPGAPGACLPPVPRVLRCAGAPACPLPFGFWVLAVAIGCHPGGKWNPGRGGWWAADGAWSACGRVERAAPPPLCLLAAKAGPGAETETGLDNKSAVAFEKHRIRLRMAAGAWRDYHGSIHARLPFVHSCTAAAAVHEDLRRADARHERAARNLDQSFAFGAPGVGAGGHRHARRGRPSAREFLLSRAAVA
jgi:hypothetical protein